MPLSLEPMATKTQGDDDSTVVRWLEVVIRMTKQIESSIEIAREVVNLLAVFLRGNSL